MTPDTQPDQHAESVRRAPRFPTYRGRAWTPGVFQPIKRRKRRWWRLNDGSGGGSDG